MNYTLKDLRIKAELELENVFTRHEISKLLHELFRGRLQISATHAMAFPDTKVSQSDFNQIEKDIHDLAANVPIQYILGKENFYGLEFEVNRNVLIPRPETEELVQWILKSHDVPDLKVLDIGTGSGCIPITLGHEQKSWKLNAIDVDEGALAVAKKNAANNQVAVNFYQLDVLNDALPQILSELDVLVSNPPYVKQEERSLMKANVLDFEPDLALFVPDNDPLVFYRKIVEIGNSRLKPGGWMYFEINEQLGQETAAILSNKGYTQVSIRKDLYGKDRMVRGQKQ